MILPAAGAMSCAQRHAVLPFELVVAGWMCMSYTAGCTDMASNVGGRSLAPGCGPSSCSWQGHVLLQGHECSAYVADWSKKASARCRLLSSHCCLVKPLSCSLALLQRLS